MNQQNRRNMKHSSNPSILGRNFFLSISAGVGSFLLCSLVACTPAPAVNDTNLYDSGYSGASISTGTIIYLNPTSSLVNGGGQVQLTASGGVKPYVFAVISGLGTVDTATGLFTASPSSGTTQVEVFDIKGNTAVATITITSGSSVYSSTSAGSAVTSLSTVDGDSCPTGGISVGTTYGVNGDRSICAYTGSSSTVVTDIRVTAGGTHQYGVSCPTGYTAMGYTPDCFGNRGCYGEQTICGSTAASGSSRTVTDFYVTTLGLHNPSGPGCLSGYVATASVVDCGGNICSGYQQICVAH